MAPTDSSYKEKGLVDVRLGYIPKEWSTRMSLFCILECLLNLNELDPY